MSVGEEKSNGFHESRKEIVKDVIEQAAQPQQHAADIPPAGRRVRSAPQAPSKASRTAAIRGLCSSC